MARRIPLVNNGAKILIICEGFEEYDTGVFRINL